MRSWREWRSRQSRAGGGGGEEDEDEGEEEEEEEEAEEEVGGGRGGAHEPRTAADGRDGVVVVVCGQCGSKSDDMRRCARCKLVWYCNRSPAKPLYLALNKVLNSI